MDMDIEGELKKIEIAAKDAIAAVEGGSRHFPGSREWKLAYERVIMVATRSKKCSEVCYELYSRILQEYLTNVTIPKLQIAIAARDSGHSFVKELVLKFEMTVFSPSDFAAEEGDTGHHVFFIAAGDVDVM